MEMMAGEQVQDDAAASAVVLLFYKYVTIGDPAALAAWVKEKASQYRLLGRVLVAEEGINGTLEGSEEATERFAAAILEDERFADMGIKTSGGNGAAFKKLTVKVRNEIVGTRFPKEVDPRVKTATYLTPEELRAWYEKKEDFVVVDMRNSYEYASGHFAGSIDPGMTNSRDLPNVVHTLESVKNKKLVTVCTGGIRCEKMSAYLLHQGFSDVYQLKDGIHTYMEKFPGKDFEGTLYTFDGRTTMDFGGERPLVGKCYLCNGATERYTNCTILECRRHFLVCDTCAPNNRSVHCGNCIL